MKKITLLAIVTIMSVATFAQQSLRSAQTVFAQKKGNTTTFATAKTIKKAAGDEMITTRPEGEIRYYNRIAGQAYNYSGSTYTEELVDQTGTVEIVFTEDNSVYILDPLYNYSTGAYVKGTLEGNVITVTTNQPIYWSDMYQAYVRLSFMDPVDGTEIEYAANTTSDITYTIDGDNIKLNDAENENFVLGAYWEDDSSWCGFCEWASEFTLFNEQPNVAPDGLETVEYDLIANGSAPAQYKVKVGKLDDKLYVQGFTDMVPEGWLIGNINGNTVTFPTGQFVGTSERGPIFILGTDDGSNLNDIVFTYNPAEDKYTLTTSYVLINGKKESVYYWSYFTNCKIMHFVETAVAPQDPNIIKYWPLESPYMPELDFYMPIEDVEGNPLVMDKLFFQIFLQRAGGELLPVVYDVATYGGTEDFEMFPVYYNGDMEYVGYTSDRDVHYATISCEDDSDFEKMGVQAIYYGGDEENRSNLIVWDIAAGEATVGITDVNTKVEDSKYYTIHGVRIDKPTQRGIYISNGRKFVVK